MRRFLYIISVCFVFFSCYKTDPEVINLLQQIISQNDSLKIQITTLQKRTDSLTNVLRTTNTSISNLDKKVDSLKSQLTLVLNQINTLNTQLTTANANIVDIQIKIAELQKKCQELYNLLNEYINSLNLNNLTFTKINSSDAFTVVSSNTPGKYMLITRTTVLKSEDFGTNWITTTWPLGIVRSSTSTNPGGSFSTFNNGQFIIASLDNGFYTTENFGTSFSQSGPTGFGCGSQTILTLPDGRFIAGMGGFQRGLWKSSGTNNQTWTKVWDGGSNSDPIDLTYYKNKVLYSCHSKGGCCSPDGGLLKSSDDGQSWTKILSLSNGIHDVEIIQDSLAWIDDKGNFYITNASSPNVNVSPTFNIVTNSTIAATSGVYEVDMKSNSSNKMIAATASSGLYISLDFGKTWKKYTFDNATNYYNITFADNYLFVGTNIGVYRTKL